MKLRTLLASIAACTMPLNAGEPAVTIETPAPKTDWEFITSIYLWGLGIDGTQGLGGRTFNVDVSFSDIVSDLDFAYTGAFELRKGRWGVLADLQYSELSVSASSPRGRLNVNLGLQQFLGNFLINYRIVDTDRAILDLYAGARLNWLDMNISGAAGLRGTSGSQTWADAIAGFRTRVALGGSWYFQANADIGAGDSDLTWQALGLFGYKLNDHWSLGAGYRAIGTDFGSGGFLFDTISHGPILGAQVRF